MTDQIKTDNARSKAEQLPLVFSHQAASGREDLLVSASLEAAVSLVDEWPNWPSPVVAASPNPGRSSATPSSSPSRCRTGCQARALLPSAWRKMRVGWVMSRQDAETPGPFRVGPVKS